jgi:hypothetical protein
MKEYCIDAVLLVAVTQLTATQRLARGESGPFLSVAAQAEGGNDAANATQDKRIPSDISAGMEALREAVAEHPVARAWYEFLDSVSADLAELHGGEVPAERQRELLRRLTEAVERLHSTLSSPGVGPIADELAMLTSRLERRVAVLSLALPLLNSREGSDELRNDVHRLLIELDRYDAHQSAESARTITALYRRLKNSGIPAAIALAEAVNTQYNHYNVRAIISGALLDNLAKDTRTESGPVRDFILGSDVFGHQNTTARVGVRLMPNAEAASMLLELQGISQAETQSYPRDQGGGVVICSRSISQFLACRTVDLTADGLRAGEPVISVHTSNQVVGASTSLSGVPLLGWIGDHIAMSAAEARHAEAEAIGASRVRERVLPRFGSESEQRIAEMNDRYRSRLVDRLTKRHAFPEVLNFSSTSTHLVALGRTARFDELGAHEPSLWLPGDSQAIIQLHESAINNAMAHAELGGRKIDENVIARLTSEAESEMEPVAEPPPETDESVISIELSDGDPVRARFDNGLVQLELRAALIQRGEDKLTGQSVIVRYGVEPLLRTVKVVRKGDIELRPQSNADNRVGTESAVVARIRDSLELMFLPEFEVAASPPLTDRHGNRVALNLADLKIRDGWLSLSFR